MKTVICAQKDCYLNTPTSTTPALLRTCFFQTMTFNNSFTISIKLHLFILILGFMSNSGKKLTAFDGGRKEKKGESLVY